VTADLYRIDAEPSIPTGPVLVYALTGFVDAGHAGHLAVAHLLANLEHRVLATFDVDQLLDYRSRRPKMIFDGDRWTSYEQPELVLHEIRDRAGKQQECGAGTVAYLVQHQLRLLIARPAAPIEDHRRPAGAVVQ